MDRSHDIVDTLAADIVAVGITFSEQGIMDGEINLFGFEGPCTLYMERDIICEEDKNCMLYIGKSDRIQVWMNGQLLASGEPMGFPKHMLIS